MPSESNNAGDEVVRDEYGFDEDGIHRNGGTFDDNGFDVDGEHEDGGVFHPETHRTRTGSRYDCDGYDWQGRDSGGYDRDGYDEDGWTSDGYDRNGYDSEGYDEDGVDRHGNTRCDNDECDEYCSCREAAHDELLDAGACVLRETGWNQYRYKRTTPTIAFEFECISNTDANGGAEALLSKYDKAYEKLVDGSSTGRGAIAKMDGSLPSRTGVEFVTVPMTLDEHRKVLAEAWPSGRLGGGAVQAWNHSKCGMHVHVSRSSLTNLTLGKMLCFMHQPENSAFHIDIACRQSSYAKFISYRSQVSNGLPNKADGGEKYSALNIKKHTVEFRIFRPSTAIPTLLKNLCYCLAVRDFCRCSSARRRELTAHAFLRWLGTTDARFTYIELDQWLRRHTSEFGAFYTSHALPSIKPRKNPPVSVA